MAQPWGISAPRWRWDVWRSLWMRHKSANLRLRAGFFFSLLCDVQMLIVTAGPQLQQSKRLCCSSLFFFTGHMKTVSMFFRLKRSGVKKRDRCSAHLKKKKRGRAYGPWRFGFRGAKQRPTGFSVIVISSFTLGPDWVHAGTNDSDSVAIFQSENPIIYLILHAHHWLWIKGVSRVRHSKKETTKKLRDLKKKKRLRCVFKDHLRSTLHLPCDAASIWAWGAASHAARAIRPHKCCRGICWLSDSDQYVCYQVRRVWMAPLSAQEEQYSNSSYSGHNSFFIGSWKSQLSNCQKGASFG